MVERTDSIFRRYYSKESFRDRFLTGPQDAVDVIIPIVHTNELWESNLLSFYREIPINRLLIGDGGCIDDSIEIARKFSRVEIFDHRTFKSLGYSLRKLIEAVETEWFIYLHSDVYLADGWFDVMKGHRTEHDWFGCPQQLTVMAEYPLVDKVRPYAGSQMGRKAAFQDGLAQIDDDYVYRQEDFILANIVEKAGYSHGRVEDTFHYHQVVHRPSPWVRKIKSVDFELEINKEEEIRTHVMQAKGIVKYLEPTPYLINSVAQSVLRLRALRALNWVEFRRWVLKTEPAWLPYIRKGLFKLRLRAFLRAVYYRFFG